MLKGCGVAVHNQRLVRVKSGDFYHYRLFLNVLAGTTNRLKRKFASAFKQVIDSLVGCFISLKVGFMLTVHRPYNNNNYLY
jgi:hypothetical protein